MVERLRLHGLHSLARVALRVRPPLRAKALVDRIGSRFPCLQGIDDARAAVHELFPTGSCLSRALTIAATLPDAEVVIGVNAPEELRVTAHAWLEVNSVCVDTTPGPGEQLPGELARLPPRQHRRPQFDDGSCSATVVQTSLQSLLLRRKS
jgi:hypothetical protein